MHFTKPAQRIASGFEFLEGPVWLTRASPLHASLGVDADALLFSDIPAARTYWWSDGRSGLFRDDTGQANGNTLDHAGNLLSCEHARRRVSRLDGEGVVTVIADRYEDRRLNSPNDVVVHRDGSIYFTDPPYGVDADDRELNFQGVFRVDPVTRDLTLLADDFEKPNGLAFAPDYSVLYVADTERGHIRALDISTAGRFGASRIVGRVERPDGVRVDAEGNIYVAALQGVEVLNPTGRRREALSLPERPANLAFGDQDGQTLYICARTSLYSARTAVAGALSVAPAPQAAHRHGHLAVL